MSERYIHLGDDAVRLAFEKLQNQRQAATVSATLVERPSASNSGGMGERLKPAVLKTAVGETPPGVRIPLPPP